MTRRKNEADAVRQDIDERGARVAYETLIGVCQDPGAPSQAKAAAGVAILRAGGFFDVKARPDEDPSSMSADQLRQALPVLEAELARIERTRSGRKAEDDLFD